MAGHGGHVPDVSHLSLYKWLNSAQTHSDFNPFQTHLYLPFFAAQITNKPTSPDQTWAYTVSPLQINSLVSNDRIVGPLVTLIWPSGFI